MKNKKLPIISVVITAHAENILTHKTIRSVRRALLDLGKSEAEILLHVDNPTPETLAYIDSNGPFLEGISIYYNSFGDLGSSRNFAIQQAKGLYIATIDADDIMSKNWIIYGLNELMKDTTNSTVVHSEYTIEFEGSNSLITKHGEIDIATDTLLSVYANRWNSVIIAPRKLLLEEPYAPNSPGYGYEDWNLNSRLIHKGIHNVLVPETAIFVRRKKDNSEWLRQIQSMSVLRANEALSFGNIRSLRNPFVEEAGREQKKMTSQAKSQLKSVVSRNPTLLRLAKKVRREFESISHTTSFTAHTAIPEWLQGEWRELHNIDRQIFLSDDLLKGIPVYDTITAEHKIAGSLYKQLIDSLEHDSYDYLIFVPWLIKGGADKYAINYANSIANIRKNKRVLVIATLPTASPWSSQLDEAVDFLDFGIITKDASTSIQVRLMEHIIENAKATHLHIINSEFAYNFIQSHTAYIKGSDKKVIVSSFSQSVESSGRIFGYSHTHVPYVYNSVDLITSDNQAVIDMWTSEYGFNPQKMTVHRQPLNPPKTLPTIQSVDERLRFLWAARISPEKNPGLVLEVAKLCPDIHIDMYGGVESGQEHILNDLPSNLMYMGGYDGFESIPHEKYHGLIYTSLFDGMPNTLLEAASVGLPVIAPAIGGIAEFIEDKNTGLLITDQQNPLEYAAAVEKLKEESVRKKLRKNALASLHSNFSVDAYEANITSMLDSLGY